MSELSNPAFYFKARSTVCVRRIKVATLKRGKTQARNARQTLPPLQPQIHRTMPPVHCGRSPMAHTEEPCTDGRARSPGLRGRHCASGTRMRMRTAWAHASQTAHAQRLQPLGWPGPERGRPSQPRPPRPAPSSPAGRLVLASLPAGGRPAPASLSLCSRSTRAPCRAPRPGLRGRGAGRPFRSALRVRGEGSGGQRREVALRMEPGWAGAAPRGPRGPGSASRGRALPASRAGRCRRMPEGPAAFANRKLLSLTPRQACRALLGWC